MKLASLVSALLLCSVAAGQGQPPPNVLFVYIEDMNMDLGTFGHPVVQTPNLDTLAAEGIAFHNAYCPTPICNPSRVNTLVGMRASTTGYTRNEEVFHQDHLLGVPILPLRYKQAGYSVGGAGKIFHRGYEHANVWDTYFTEGWDPGIPYPINPSPDEPSRPIYWGPYENGPDGSLGDLDDTKTSDAAMQMMSTLPEPWFVAVGYRAPHLPFIYPEALQSLYDPVTDVPPLPIQEIFGSWKTQVPQDSWRNIWHYFETIWDNDPEGARREATVAYWRCATYIDQEFGRIMAHLNAIGARDNTIVVFVSDHGWSMGEHCRFAKQALFDQSARVPLIVSVPDALTDGQACHRPVELVDLYPTLMDYCGLVPPAGLDGLTLRPLIDDPTAPFRPAFSVDERWNSTRWNRMVRTDQYKFIYDERGTHHLYDMVADPGEYTNLFGNPAFDTVVQQHIAHLENEGVLKASWSNYHAGFPGTSGVPTLTASAPPVLGNVIDIEIGNSSGANAAAALLLGTYGVKFPLIGLGGNVLADPLVAISFTIPAAGVSFPTTIANDPGLTNERLALQTIQLDPGAEFGLAFSQGLRLFMYPF